MSRQAGALALAAVWSPTSVSVYDPATHQVATGANLREVAGRLNMTGRDLVVGISQRNTFIRTLPAPNVPRVELAKIIQVRLGPLLPVGGHEYVSGFRVGGGHGESKVAIVGAVRADLLKTVHAEATDAGVNLKAILPFAFASFLLAKERSVSDCVVVASTGDQLTLDVIRGGELRYSRAVPAPETEEEFQSELDVTFRVADTGILPVLAAGAIGFQTEIEDPRPLMHAFTDASEIDRLLFSLEPLETTIARETRKRQMVAGRALAAAAVAVLLGCYAALSAHFKLVHFADQASDHDSKLNIAKHSADKAIKSQAKVHDSFMVVNKAFFPAQSFADVIRVLGDNSLSTAWFTGLTIERGRPLLIRGDASDLKTVAKYVAELSKSDRFREVKLVFTHKATIAKRQVVQFAVSGRIVGNLPLDEVPRDVKTKSLVTANESAPGSDTVAEREGGRP